MLNFNKFFRSVHGRRLESATNVFEPALDKADKRLEGCRLTYPFGAVEQALLWRLGTEQMRQTIWTAIPIPVLGNADSRVREMIHLVIDELAVPLYYILAGAYLPLIVKSGGRKEKTGLTSKILRSLFLKQVIFFLCGAFR